MADGEYKQKQKETVVRISQHEVLTSALVSYPLLPVLTDVKLMTRYRVFLCVCQECPDLIITNRGAGRKRGTVASLLPQSLSLTAQLSLSGPHTSRLSPCLNCPPLGNERAEKIRLVLICSGQGFDWRITSLFGAFGAGMAR